MSTSNQPIDSEWFAELKRKAALADELVAILMKHCGERGETEGAADTLNRLIRERHGYVSHPGWRLVPVEPTKEMIVAGQDEHDNCIDTGYDSDADGNRYDYTTISPDAPTRVYTAMVAAAPSGISGD